MKATQTASPHVRRKVAGAQCILATLFALAAACSGHGSSGSPEDAGRCDGTTCTDGGRDAAHDTGRKPGHDAARDATHPDGGADAGVNLEALNPTVASNLAFSSAFLYTGPDAVQTGVAAGTINPTRVSVIRGQVSVHSTAAGATNGLAAIANVEVTVLGHPEYGTTTTQSDGWFSLAVNGGGVLTVAV